jgi:hypothetical protein
MYRTRPARSFSTRRAPRAAAVDGRLGAWQHVVAAHMKPSNFMDAADDAHAGAQPDRAAAAAAAAAAAPSARQRRRRVLRGGASARRRRHLARSQ